MALALMLAPAPSHAQTPTSPPPAIYSCTDADGRVISSDRPIAACAQREMREMNRDGSVRRVIAPPLTRAQEREAAQRERLREDQDRARKAQQSRDRNLLLMFENEQALESMRRRGLADVEHEIRLATTRILSIDRQLKSAQLDAAGWQSKHPGRPLPFHHQQRIIDAANAILAEDSLIRDRESERTRLEARFEADRQRLRELLGKPALGDASGSQAETR